MGGFYLEGRSETDLLSVVTEDPPGGAEEDEVDLPPDLGDHPLWTTGQNHQSDADPTNPTETLQDTQGQVNV